MKSFLRYALTALALAFVSLPSAANATTCSGGTPANNCYWIGGTGTWDNSSTTHWSFTSGGTTCTCLPSATTDKATFDASSGGGTVTADSTLNNSTFQSITMGAFTGTLDFATSNPNITLTNEFSGTGTGTRTLNLGNGTWTLSGSVATGVNWDFSVVTNLTFNANSSTIVWGGNGVNGSSIWNGGGKTYNIVTMNSSTGTPKSFGNTGGTIATLNLNGPARYIITGNATQTIGTLNAIGTSTGLIQFDDSAAQAVKDVYKRQNMRHSHDRSKFHDRSQRDARCVGNRDRPFCEIAILHLSLIHI